MKLEHIRVILVRPSHPGNIGATARAMKNMGLTQLVLVAPDSFPDPKANERAANADDILDNAQVVTTLDDALQDCRLIMGASARSRAIPWPVIDVRQAAQEAAQQTNVNHPVAILFGRERTGLENDELRRCHYHIQIPANPDYCSLNLAAAVQVICYELRMQLDQTVDPGPIDPPASYQEVENFYQHLEQTLKETNFLTEKNPRQSMTRLRRLFSRIRLEEMEISLLRGVLRASQRTAARAKRAEEEVKSSC